MEPGDSNTATNTRAHEASEAPTIIQQAPPAQPGLANYCFLMTLIGHTQTVTSLKFSPCGVYLASASVDATIYMWSVKYGKLTQTLNGHKNSINDIAWSPNSLFLASVLDDKTVKIWEVECIKTLEGHTSYVFCCTYNLQRDDGFGIARRDCDHLGSGQRTLQRDPACSLQACFSGGVRSYRISVVFELV
ncbi:unnamed protein product [Angiostrongylus costaricensis]|uniref:WD_REPEATS_REGION domain-containing protein n=1 Tax=Angiostrongylus costaricensis TaxID=334426 RepID=A0A0R3PL41_ANGCS|nr:unnamed protein product [Angiostrongylus costaricensis]